MIKTSNEVAMPMSVKLFIGLIGICGALVFGGGMLGIVIQPAAAEVVVELIRNSPSDEANIIAGDHLNNVLRMYYSLFLMLGLVIMICSALAFNKIKIELGRSKSLG